MSIKRFQTITPFHFVRFTYKSLLKNTHLYVL